MCSQDDRNILMQPSEVNKSSGSVLGCSGDESEHVSVVFGVAAILSIIYWASRKTEA